MPQALLQRHRFPWKYHLLGIVVSAGLTAVYWWFMVDGVYKGNTADHLFMQALQTVAFYVSLRFVWPRVIFKGRIVVKRILVLFAAMLLLIVVGLIVLSAALGSVTVTLTWENLNPFGIPNLFPLMLPVALALVFSFLGFLIERLCVSFFNRLRMDRQLQSTRVAWRRAQLNPHLLNELFTMLRVIVDEAPDRAVEAMNIIIEMTHFYIGSNTPDERILLADELEQVYRMKALQQIRYGNDLNWNVYVSGDISGVQVVPMLLLEPAQNMVRYGVISDPENPAFLFVNVGGGQVTVRTLNQKRITDTRSSGTGLRNLQEQLAFFYPGKHTFCLSEESGSFSMVINIPSDDEKGK